jgi:hypothetical protein
MILVLLPLTSSFSHETPTNRIAFSYTVHPETSLFESPLGLLAMANHNDFVTYVGLSHDRERRWYRSQYSGFHYFGASSATVEFVATTDTKFIYSCVYLGSACTHVEAAISGIPATACASSGRTPK